MWGYSLSVTEPRAPLYEYPESQPGITNELTNLELPPDAEVAAGAL